jgi:hypothetical protein
MKANPSVLDVAIERCLVNPTKEMTIAFQKLPSAHKWMLFALLEAERNSFFKSKGNIEAVKESYSALCPIGEQKPFETVAEELSEAFIRRIKGFLGSDYVEWIHPSCRDLTIQELSIHVAMRRHFLRDCTTAGIELAISPGGGVKGERMAPLLVDPQDWEILKERAISSNEKSPRLLVILWKSYKVINREKTLPIVSDKLLGIIRMVWPLLIQRLKEGQTSLRIHELHSLFEIRSAVDTETEIPGLEEVLLESCDDLASAMDERKSITEAGATVSSFASLVRLLKANEPNLFRKKKVRINLQQIIDLLLERGDSEQYTYFSRSDGDKDTCESEADGYTKLSDAYGEVALLDVVSEKDEERLDSFSDYFKSEADSLEEEISERFPDDSNPLHEVTTLDMDSNDEDHSISIKKLFDDL